MAIEAAGAYFHHVSVSPERVGEGCGICSKPLDLEAVGHFEDKGSHIFHKDCLFTWLRRRESCPVCFQKAMTPPPFAYYYLFPDFQITCPNTEENRKTVAKNAAEVYSFFLKHLAHQGSIHQTLLERGVMVGGFFQDEAEVPRERIEIFEKYLMDQIKTRLKYSLNSSLEVIYAPHPKGLLFEAFRRANIDLDRYASYLPRYTKILIQADEESIRLTSSFRWFANDEKLVEVEWND